MREVAREVVRGTARHGAAGDVMHGACVCACWRACAPGAGGCSRRVPRGGMPHHHTVVLDDACPRKRTPCSLQTHNLPSPLLAPAHARACAPSGVGHVHHRVGRGAGGLLEALCDPRVSPGVGPPSSPYPLATHAPLPRYPDTPGLSPPNSPPPPPPGLWAPPLLPPHRPTAPFPHAASAPRLLQSSWLPSLRTTALRGGLSTWRTACPGGCCPTSRTLWRTCGRGSGR